MFAYITVTLLPLITALTNNKILRLTTPFVLAILLCTAYYNGSDWRQFELAYIGGGFDYEYWEWGFSKLFFLLASTGISFFPALILFKLFIFTFTALFLRGLLKGDYWLGISIFCSTSAIFLFVDNPLRQFAALPFFLLGYAALRQGQLAKLLFYCVAGSFVHFSVNLLIILWAIRRVNPVTISFFAICAFLVVSFAPDFVVNMLVLLSPFEILSNLDWYLRWYLTDVTPQFGGSSVIYLLLILIYLFFYAVLPCCKNTDFNLGVLYLWVGVFSVSIEELARLNAFLWLPLVLALVPAFRNLRKAFFLFYTLLLLLQCNIVIFDYRYLPYSNYFIEMAFEREFRYWERSKFHLEGASSE